MFCVWLFRYVCIAQPWGECVYVLSTIVPSHRQWGPAESGPRSIIPIIPVALCSAERESERDRKRERGRRDKRELILNNSHPGSDSQRDTKRERWKRYIWNERDGQEIKLSKTIGFTQENMNAACCKTCHHDISVFLVGLVVRSHWIDRSKKKKGWFYSSYLPRIVFSI